MLQHVTGVRRDTTLASPRDTATTGTIEAAPDYHEIHYREIQLRDGASIFIPIVDESVPTD